MSRSIVTVIVVLAGMLPTAGWAASPPPVYAHMNGGNYFLEPVVAVLPGQKVVFVNQDTDAHTVVFYDPRTGSPLPNKIGTISGTKGPTDAISTYSVSFNHPGFKFYYCSVHAQLKPTFNKLVQPVKRAGTGGFAGPMAGVVVVTTDTALLQQNPPTTAERVLDGYFGG